MLDPELSRDEQLNEKVLLKELSRGSYKAFTTLYEIHVIPVTNYASKFTNDLQLIEDALHDTFVWLWNNRQKLEITYSLKAYLFKSVRSAILKKVERGKKVILQDNPIEKNMYSLSASVEDRYIQSQDESIVKERLIGFLELLTPKQKEVIYLRFYQGLSFDEIAANMNLSIKACYKLMGRAIAELRRTCSNPITSLFILLSFFL